MTRNSDRLIEFDGAGSPIDRSPFRPILVERWRKIEPTIIGGVRATSQIRNDFVFLADALLSPCAQSFACNRTVDGEKV
jgi:hypothetical protein